MKINSRYYILAALLLLIPLAGLAYLGTFTRFYADDFCMAGDAMHIGLPGMLAKWYEIWTGRFSFLLGTGLFGLGGPKLAGWMPAIILIVWLIALTWTIFPPLKRAGWHNPGPTAGLAGGLIVLIVLSTTPNLFQSFFWQDGMVNYTLPLIGLTLTAGIVLRAWLDKPALWPFLLGAFGVTFISGGFTEVVSAMQIGLILLALAATLLLSERAKRGRLTAVLVAALAGGLAAIAIVLVAPGNQVRLATSGAAPGLIQIIIFSIRNAAYIAGKYVIWTPGRALLSAAVPFLAGWMACSNCPTSAARINLRLLWAQNWFRGAILVLLAAFGLAIAACAPVVFALNAYPDDRAIIVPQYVLAVGVISASTLLGYGLRSLGILTSLVNTPSKERILQAAILACLLIAAGSSLWNSAAQAPAYQSYAQAWDIRAADLLQANHAGLTDVNARGLNSWFGVADLAIDPGFWVNGCVARFYGLITVSGH